MEPRPDRTRRGALRLFPLGAIAALAASCAAPAPETAAPAPSPSPGERAYIVFFEWGSSRIGPRGREIVAEAARNAGGGSGRVELQAFADRSGRSSRNQSLSERRAEAVAAELVRQGVSRNEIGVQAFGESRPLVPTADNVREPQNRRVEIVLR